MHNLLIIDYFIHKYTSHAVCIAPHTQTLTQALTYTHITRTHTHTLSLLSHICTHSLSHTHTHTHILLHTYTHQMSTAPLGSSLSGVSPIKMRSSSFDDDTDRGHLGGDKVHNSGSD